jgi:hypothetical protein
MRRFVRCPSSSSLKFLGRIRRAAKRWAAQGKRSLGGDYYNTQIAYLGPEYIRIALGQYYQNRINDIQLAEYLNIAPKNLAAFEARFSPERTVVTMETLRPDAARIPNICEHFKVPCLSLEGFMEKESWQF